jgi:hypothetical protein
MNGERLMNRGNFLYMGSQALQQAILILLF